MAKIIEIESPGPDDPIFKEGPTSYNPHPKPEGKPEPGAWLPEAHFGFVGNPLPPLAEDTEEDPDDEELAVTPPEVVMILGWDPLDADEDGDDQEGETVPSI